MENEERTKKDGAEIKEENGKEGIENKEDTEEGVANKEETESFKK